MYFISFVAAGCERVTKYGQWHVSESDVCSFGATSLTKSFLPLYPSHQLECRHGDEPASTTWPRTTPQDKAEQQGGKNLPRSSVGMLTSSDYFGRGKKISLLFKPLLFESLCYNDLPCTLPPTVRDFKKFSHSVPIFWVAPTPSAY